uniref:Tetraspanin n=1 Tax=Hirondellea gigas TaxID=1518452 RepID=A0A2P2I7A9_9CRUS
MGCVSNCILVLVNLLVLLMGLAVIALSSVVLHTTKDYNRLIMEGVLMLPMWTLIGGICLTMVGFFGCCGAIRKSACMLRLYGALVLVFFGMELVCGILLLVNRDHVVEVLEDRMMKTFMKYNESDQALTDSIDIAQHDLECCGVNSYQDWFILLNSNDVTPGCCTGQLASADTCYKNINELNPETELPLQIYKKGCFSTMVEDLGEISTVLGIMCIVLVSMQLLCIIFAFVTASKVARRKEYNNIQLMR